MDNDLIYFDTVLLQQDFRIRLPKSLVVNIEGEPGKSKLEVYLNAQTKEIVLKEGSAFQGMLPAKKGNNAPQNGN